VSFGAIIRFDFFFALLSLAGEENEVGFVPQ